MTYLNLRLSIAIFWSVIVILATLERIREAILAREYILGQVPGGGCVLPRVRLPPCVETMLWGCELVEDVYLLTLVVLKYSMASSLRRMGNPNVIRFVRDARSGRR